jgi:hypothetical protein
VLKRFGIDPENPGAFRGDEGGSPSGHSAPRPFWDAAAEAEDLPLYLRARDYAVGLGRFVDGRFGRLLSRPYKDPARRRLQVALLLLCAHARETPKNVAAGHSLGYEAGGIKGNIARCRRALFHADACVGLLSRLAQRPFRGASGRVSGTCDGLTRTDHRRLFAAALGLRNALSEWITFLRGRS